MMKRVMRLNTDFWWVLPRRFCQCALLTGLMAAGSTLPSPASAIQPPDPLEITIGILGPDDLTDGAVSQILLPTESIERDGGFIEMDGEDSNADPTWTRDYYRPEHHDPNADYSYQPSEQSSPPPSPPPPSPLPLPTPLAPTPQ